MMSQKLAFQIKKRKKTVESNTWKPVCPKLLIVAIFGVLPIFGFCKKFIDVGVPQNELVRKTVFNSNSSANAAIFSLYSQLAQGTSYTYFSLYPGLLSDELTNYSFQEANIELYKNSVLPTNINIEETWKMLYRLIYESNSVIEGIEASDGVSNHVKSQLKGEALFFRAFLNFNLLNLFGNVPLVKSTSASTTALLPQVDSATMYTEIITDLLEAKKLVNEKYLGADGESPSNERLRLNKSAVSAFLAKVYLYAKNYSQAKSLSSEVIEDPRFILEEDLSKVFLKDSKEAILQLTNGNAFNTFEGLFYILTTYPSEAALNPHLVKTFDLTDQRRISWIGMFTTGTDTLFYPNKYKIQYSTIVSEYVMVFRLAEQYLIRSECEALLGNIPNAIRDLNKIRARAGLTDTSLQNSTAILNEILKERQKELFTEWSNRWFDLKRTGLLDKLMPEITLSKGSSWETTKKIMPIPQNEINKNRSLKQNSGY